MYVMPVVIYVVFSIIIGECHGQLIVNMELPNDESYTLLYEMSLKHYARQNFPSTQSYLELAIADKRYRDVMLLKCHKRCASSYDINFEETFFLSLVRRQKCTKKCMKELFGEPLQLPLYVIQDFKNRKPFSFLQWSYYQMENIQAAYDASITHLKHNPDQEFMKKNVAYYGNLVNHNTDLPYERDDSYTLFKAGLHAYSRDDYFKSTPSFNTSLHCYVEEVMKCKTLCEIGYDMYKDRKIPILQGTNTFYDQFVKLYHTVMECRYKCFEKYNKVIKGQEDYLPTILNYLQFSAYKAGEIEFAAQLGSLYLHITPGDQAMTDNVNFYTKILGAKPQDLKKFSDFIKQNDIDMEILSTIVGKKEMRQRLKDKQNYVLGDIGLVSELNPNPNVLWTNTY